MFFDLFHTFSRMMTEINAVVVEKLLAFTIDLHHPSRKRFFRADTACISPEKSFAGGLI